LAGGGMLLKMFWNNGYWTSRQYKSTTSQIKSLLS